MAAHISDIPWPLVVALAKNINTDPSYSRTMDPDMALSGKLEPDGTMDSSGSTGHGYLFDPTPAMPV